MDKEDGIQDSKMKEKIRKECLRQIRSIMKTELNAKNIIIAINTLALPMVTYSFNIINWNLNEFKRLDAKIRLKVETRGLFAAQDQSLFTRNYQANII